MLAIVPPAVIATRIYGRWIKRLSTTVQDQLATTTSIAEESLAGIRTIRAFDAHKHILNRYSNGIDKAFNTARERAYRIAAFGGIAGLVGYGAVCGVLWYGGQLYVNEQLSLGELTSFMLYTFTIAFSISALGTVWQSFMKAAGASKRVFDVIDLEVNLLSGSEEPVEPFERLVFEKVGFNYPARADMPVLNDLSFELKHGSKLAIVGPSGAGKSTIAALIARLYDPSEGQVRVNDTPLDALNIHWWRSQFGVVFQASSLFAYSIRENLLLGNPDASSERLWAALESAQLSDFVRSLPNGLDTDIGEKGVQLSGGQRQRMSIARLFVKDPSLIILDEATSSLDSSTETQIKLALDQLLKTRSAVIIAHRLSTVTDADQILYLENGKIIDKGNHSQLLTRCKPYRMLVETQMLDQPKS